MNRTKIEYADFTWNPVVGCTRECDYCYARRIALQNFKRSPSPCEKCRDFVPHRHYERLEQPMRKKKPARIFVCDMGDLFDATLHANVIIRVFDVMAAAPQHTFLVLTKQPYRMSAILGVRKPLPNLHLGVSVTCQADADERIPILLDTPAAVRWVSIEPMMGPVDLTMVKWAKCDFGRRGEGWSLNNVLTKRAANELNPEKVGLDWVVLGGMTGPMAKGHLMDPAWVRSVRDQCVAAEIPFFFKSWGAWIPGEEQEITGNDDDETCHLLRRSLDGREWNELPEGRER